MKVEMRAFERKHDQPEPSMNTIRRLDYTHWRADRIFLLVPAQEYVAKYIATFKEFPPSQRVGGVSLDQVLANLQSAQTGGR
jgi:arylsulfatase